MNTDDCLITLEAILAKMLDLLNRMEAELTPTPRPKRKRKRGLS